MHKKAWLLIALKTVVSPVHRCYASLGCREAEAAYRFINCVACEGLFARRAKTNLSMCLKRREALSLGRFAERVLTCLNLSAAEVPCKTAPFASFSGRTEKEGPARPERGSISSSLIKVIKKDKRNGEIYEIVLSGEFSLITFIVMPVSLTRLHSLCSLPYHHSAMAALFLEKIYIILFIWD